MSLHTRCHQGPRKPSSCATFTLNSLWGRADTGGKSCICARRVALVVFNSLQPFALWPARLLCQRGVLQAKILECIGQYWLPYPSSTPYFLLPLPPTPLSTWCCQNPCNTSSCTTSTPGPHWGKAKSSRAASEANPSGMTHMQRWK